MVKKLLFFIVCTMAFIVEASSLQPGRQRGPVQRSLHDWNVAYPDYKQGDRRVKVNTPQTDTSIGDLNHRLALWKPLRRPLSFDARHELAHTFSGHDYVAYDKEGNEIGSTGKALPMNQRGSYYESLSVSEMQAEHELFIAELAYFLGVQEEVLASDKAFDCLNEIERTFTPFISTNKNIVDRIAAIQSLTPEEQVRRFKELELLYSSLKTFLHVINSSQISASQENFIQFVSIQRVVQKEYALVVLLCAIWKKVVTARALDQASTASVQRELATAKEWRETKRERARRVTALKEQHAMATKAVHKIRETGSFDIKKIEKEYQELKKSMDDAFAELNATGKLISDKEQLAFVLFTIDALGYLIKDLNRERNERRFSFLEDIEEEVAQDVAFDLFLELEKAIPHYQKTLQLFVDSEIARLDLQQLEQDEEAALGRELRGIL